VYSGDFNLSQDVLRLVSSIHAEENETEGDNAAKARRGASFEA
jgi:hypothetical protein